MVGKTSSVSLINEDNNVKAKLSASQYGFRAGVSIETALYEFVRRVEHCLVRKKSTLLQTPADRRKKTKVFERNFKCQILDKKNAIKSKSVLNQNTVKVYTDGSKLKWESRCKFLCRISKQLPKTSIFSPWNTQHCVPGRSLSYSRSGKEPAFGKKCSIKVLLCWWIVKQLSNHS